MSAEVLFLLGRAGSGKSKRIAEAIRTCMKAGERAVLFVPEQFTFETEKRLSQELCGLLGVQVLSFTRFCERALTPMAEEQGRPFLSAQGRRMVFKRSIHRLRGKLTVLAPAADRPGFAGRMDELYAMCRRFQITPEDLKQAAEGMPEGDSLRNKLLDIALLFSDVEEFLKSRYLDSEEAFSALLPLLGESVINGAHVFVDGFDLLTAQLYALFGGIMEHSGSVTFTVCIHTESFARDAGVFAPEERAFSRLLEMARERGCRIKTEKLPPPPVECPADHLIRELFAYPVKPWESETDEITILSASSRALEAEALGDAIQKLARQGVRYRDMAVIAGDMPAYAELIQRALHRRGIPVFLDARREMEGHPAAELIMAAVRAAAEGFSAQQLIRVARTGLAGVTVDGLELFENFILERGLRGGKQLSEPFTDGPVEAEEARRILTEPLLALRDGLKAADTAGGKAAAVREYLLTLGVEGQLAVAAENLLIEKRHGLMREHAQAWDAVCTLLEQLTGILGDVPMKNDGFLAVLTEAFASCQVGVIPATADQVLLGTITRTRSRPVRALFVLGCNEGILPAAHGDDGIIDDDELDVLRRRGLSPWGSTAVRAENEALGLYQAFSKAGERIWLSYACSGGRGELLPSSLIHTVRAIFPNCKMEYAIEGAPVTVPESREAGFAALVSALREGEDRRSGRAKALLHYYRTDDAYGPRTEQALRYRDTPLSPPAFGPAAAKRIYGPGRLTTASRLETFHACPYQYFLKYGVRAHERREFRQRGWDKGSFCHLVLERFGKAVEDWDALTPEGAERILEELYPGCMADYDRGRLLLSPRMQAEALIWKEALRRAVTAMLRQIQAGDYRPVGFEMEFGPGKPFPAITVTLPDGSTAAITGTIDRVDGAQGEDGALLRVVDYKTGSLGFDEKQLLAGIQLQLPLYLAAAEAAKKAAKEGKLAELLSGKEPVPAGLFYQPLRDPAMRADTEKEAARALRLTGVLLDEEIPKTERIMERHSEVVHGLERTKEGFRGSPLRDAPGLKRILDTANRRAGEAVAAVIEGEAAVSPLVMQNYKACKWCEFASVCRFENGVGGCKTRKGD